MKPGDLVVVDESFASSSLRIVGVDYMRRELYKTISNGIMLSEYSNNCADPGTLCTVLEIREIDIKYVSKVTQKTDVKATTGLMTGITEKLRPDTTMMIKTSLNTAAYHACLQRF